MLHLFAVRKILNKLDPPLEGKRVSLFSDEKSLGVWLSSVRKIRHAIESTLCIPSQHEIALSLRCDATLVLYITIELYSLTD